MNRIKAWVFNLLQRVLRSRGMELAAAGSEQEVRRLARAIDVTSITGIATLLERQGVDLVIDVGAAVGKYGLSLRREGYQGRICSFEPLSAQFAKLESTASGDPAWEVRNLALGPEPGSAEINVSGNLDSSSVLPMEDRHSQSAPASVYVGTETIEVSTVDAVWDEIAVNAERPFLKLDVQGYELETLRGATRSLPRVRGVQAELSLVPLYGGAPLWLEVIEFMRVSGFHVAGIEPGYTDPSTGEMLQVDGIFLRG